MSKLAKNHGLKEGEWIVPDEAIRDLIRYYTREAGVRSLERELANLARKTVRDLEREKLVSNASALLVDKVARGELGRKSGRGFYSWDEA